MNTDALILRNLDPEQDLAALVDLWQTAEARDHSGFNMDEETLRSRLNLPGHDPRRERWVVQHPEQPAALIGYALTWLRPDSPDATLEINLMVHPDWRAGGLPERLWQHLLSQARSQNARRLHIYTARHPFCLAGFWVQRGFTLEGGYSLLRRTRPDPLPETPLPEGFSLRAYAELNDLELATRAMNEAYHGLPGHNEVSLAQMASWMPDFDPQGFFLLFDPQGGLAGICRTEINAAASQNNGRSTGYIDAPGLLPPYRKAEYYRALLSATSGWLYNQGAEWLEMESWGDAQETLEIYLSAGFEWAAATAGYGRVLEQNGASG